MPCRKTKLEQHRLGIREVHDAFHVVFDGLDEARAALRVFILGLGAFGGVGLGIIKPVAFGGVLADAVLVVKTNVDVEPDGELKAPY